MSCNERLELLISKTNEIVRAINFQLPKFIKVLYIEDNDNDFELLESLLKLPGKVTYEIERIKSSDIGIEKILEKKHDLYLVDYKLNNNKNGIEVIHEATKLGMEGPFIIISGYYDAEFYEDALKENIVGFIHKDLIGIQNQLHSYTLVDNLIRFGVKNFRVNKTSKDFIDSYNKYRLEEKS